MYPYILMKILPKWVDNLLFFTVVYQGIHFVDHIIIIFQRTLFDLPSSRATGILGVFFDRNSAHLVVNLLLLYLLIGLSFLIIYDAKYKGSMIANIIFVITGIQLWHMMEHSVQTIRLIYGNCEAPCNGFVDTLLGIDESWLHLFLNGFIFLSLVVVLIIQKKYYSKNTEKNYC